MSNKTGEKSVLVKVDETIKRQFDIATKVRQDTMQKVLARAIQAYIDETEDLQRQGLLKIFGRS